MQTSLITFLIIKEKKYILHKKKKNQTTRHLILSRFQLLWWSKNQDLRFFFYLSKHPFLIYFWSKTSRKYSGYIDKYIHGLKKQTRKTSKIKNLIEFIYVFLGTFKIKKKTLKLNSSHQMKSFDTNIKCFLWSKSALMIFFSL